MVGYPSDSLASCL